MRALKFWGVFSFYVAINSIISNMYFPNKDFTMTCIFALGGALFWLIESKK
jgi:hypothetical protein